MSAGRAPSARPAKVAGGSIGSSRRAPRSRRPARSRRRTAARCPGRVWPAALRSRPARGGQEGADDLPPPGGLGLGDRVGLLDPAAGLAGQWRAATGERSTIGTISPKGMANMSCSTKASRSAGVSVSSTTSRARPIESASTASCSGFVPAAAAWSMAGGSIGSSRRPSLIPLTAAAPHHVTSASCHEVGGAPAPSSGPGVPRARRTRTRPRPTSPSNPARPICAVDSAFQVDRGNHSCHNTPRKKNPPR
jgi:hypothetical protein